MHGIVLKGLKDFVVEQYDLDTWHALRENAGIEMKMYVPISEYPDEEVLALVDSAVELTGIDAPDLLAAFGEFLVPQLVETYGVHVDEDWTGLDLIANVETYIHEALRAKNLSEFAPPELSAERVGDDRVSITYASDRELCDLAKGLVRGIGAYYDEQLAVDEPACMHDGDPHCELVVTRM